MNLYDCRDLVAELNRDFEKSTYNSKFVPYALDVTSTDFTITFLGYTIWRESHLLATDLFKNDIKEFVHNEAYYLLQDIDIYHTYLKDIVNG